MWHIWWRPLPHLRTPRFTNMSSNKLFLTSALAITAVAGLTTLWFGAQVLAPVAAIAITGVFVLAWAADL